MCRFRKVGTKPSIASVTRGAFSLIELLVSIALLGILIGLTITAVQRVRSSAAAVQCQNHLKQLALAMNNHQATHKSFPTGGWGWFWIGVPDRGYNKAQPAGWAYNILTFLEKNDLRRLGSAKTGAPFHSEMVQLLNTPIPVFHCPSRREPVAYPGVYSFKSADAKGATVTISTPLMARTDYAANAGDTGTIQCGQGPNSLKQGDGSAFWQDVDYRPGEQCNGMIYQRSMVRMKQITRGTSNVYLIGEKQMNSSHYVDGVDYADNETVYVGFDNDLYRSTINRPQVDRPDSNFGFVTYRWGSAHPAGIFMAYVDGSVRSIQYTIDPKVFRKGGPRYLLPGE